MKLKHKNRSILKWAKKIKAIEMLGGKCEICGDDNILHLVFHHKNMMNDKEIEINKIRDNRWSIIEKELKKCILLCQNCHNEIHKVQNETIFKENKRLFLEFKNVDSCKKCGYNNYIGSLHFHHENNKDFSFHINLKFKNINDLSKEIVDELNKCIVLCGNCHQDQHNNGFFEKYKEEIYEKSRNIRENTPKIDREIVKKMYFDEGKRQIDIVKFFGCKKGTISDIIKKLKLDG